MSVVSPQRVRRMAGWGAVGASGVVVDLTVTSSLLGTLPVIAANTAGFLLAVTWNFALNQTFVFSGSGRLPVQYLSYVALHSLTFGVRVAVLTAVLAVTTVSPLVASIIGVAVAAALNFVGSEQILTDHVEWFDALAALNSVAHWLWESPLRTVARRSGLYDSLFSGYEFALKIAHTEDSVTLNAGELTAGIATESGPETVSVMHTLEKEQPILNAWAGVIDEGDIVWDVGANVGVFAALAAQRADSVLAFEPVGATAARCRANLVQTPATTRTSEVALGAEPDEGSLSVERDEVGTQTPALGRDGDKTVEVVPGDAVDPQPDVVKIDVEGSEMAVLDGLANSIPHCRAVLVECHDGTRSAVRDRLTSAGLAVGQCQVSGAWYVLGHCSSQVARGFESSGGVCDE